MKNVTVIATVIIYRHSNVKIATTVRLSKVNLLWIARDKNNELTVDRIYSTIIYGAMNECYCFNFSYCHRWSMHIYQYMFSSTGFCVLLVYLRMLRLLWYYWGRRCERIISMHFWSQSLFAIWHLWPHILFINRYDIFLLLQYILAVQTFTVTYKKEAMMIGLKINLQGNGYILILDVSKLSCNIIDMWDFKRHFESFWLLFTVLELLCVRYSILDNFRGANHGILMNFS